MQKIDEKKLTKEFLIPLYESEGMGCKNVRYTHRKLEFGKDLIYFKDDEYGNRKYTGVQVKTTKITTSDAKKIFSQISEAFGEPFTDSSDGKKRNLDNFVVLTSNEFLEEAKDSLRASLEGAKLNKLVTVINGNKLVTLLGEYLPSAFWDEYDYFSKYFSKMKEDFEKIKDIPAIGQKKSVPLEDTYVPLRLSEKIRKHEPPIEKEITSKEELMKRKTGIPTVKERIFGADIAIKNNDRLVIVGDPGSGKTTLLKYFALRTCKENLEKQERTCVPIFIALREFSDSGKDLREYIEIVFEKYQFPEAKEFLEKDMKEGRCRLLLDGFDELITKERQEKIIEHIRGFMKKYPKCQIIVTSRITGYHDELKGFTKLGLMEFDDIQIEKFIENWFAKTDPGKVKSIVKAIKENEQIKAIARNPLMIAIIAIIYEEDRKLPQKRVTLYERCVEVLLSKWDAQRKLENRYDPDEKEFILKKLAFNCHSHNKRVLTKKEVVGLILEYLPQVGLKKEDAEPFLDEICQRSSLLRRISIDSYDFLHLSFQEYFTALELRGQRTSTIIEHLLEPWWEEPILLYAGIIKDATPLIESIKKNVQEDIFYSNLILFGKCVANANFTRTSLKKEIVKDLWHLYQTAEFRSLKEKAIHVLSLIKPDNFIDSPIKDLEGKDSVVRANAAEALGNIGSEKVIKPLIKTLKTDKNSEVRANAALALGFTKSEKVIKPLIKTLKTDKNIGVRARAALALGFTKSEKVIKPLIKTLKTDKNSFIRTIVAIALGGTRSEKAIEPLIKTLKTDKNSLVRNVAVSALWNIRSEKDIEPLIKTLKTDKNSEVRARAALELGFTKSEKAIEPLIKTLKTDKNSEVRARAALELGFTKSEKAIEPLIKTLKTDKNSFIRTVVAMVFGHIRSEKAIEPLIKTLKTDKNSEVRANAALALGFTKSEKAIEPLIKTLKTDKNSEVRANAAEALGNIGSEKAIEPLIKTLKTDKNIRVRAIAALVLGFTKSEKVIKPLIKTLKTDKNSFVRANAAKALGNIGSEKAIEPLIKTLKTDKHSLVRANAAEALGNIGSEKVIKPLKSALNDKGEYFQKVKDAAFNSIEKVSRRIKKRIITSQP